MNTTARMVSRACVPFIGATASSSSASRRPPDRRQVERDQSHHQRCRRRGRLRDADRDQPAVYAASATPTPPGTGMNPANRHTKQY